MINNRAFKGVNWFWFTAILFAFLSCQPEREVSLAEFYESELFEQVQMTGVFADSKTFVDCVPKYPLSQILNDYEKAGEDVDLKAFILDRFELPPDRGSDFVADTSRSMQKHIESLWPVLTQKKDVIEEYSSLIPLSNDYVVPGGRFREIYYWDSYFTQLGLMIQGQEDLAASMVKNFAFLIDSIGFIPNGNRYYYMGRSQPPFFSLMVKLVAADNRDQFVSFLPAMLAEYEFWMDGSEQLSSEQIAYRRVVRLNEGVVLNRYYDDFSGPRPESYKEDVELVEHNQLPAEETYTHLRAGAESGWDYSSRWLEDHQSLSTIETTDIIPIDLNALMYHMEIMIAQGYNWKGEVNQSKEFLNKAETRKNAINQYLWDEEAGFYVDYDFVEGNPTGVLSLAGVFPLYFELADKAQGRKVGQLVDSLFLAPGGFLTTHKMTGQQWDAPNAWAPLQWTTINGLYNYGFYELGNEGARRWLARNKQVYKSTGKMMEKYNAVDVDLLAGGGEYPLQDGFGWTNGVAVALQKILDEEMQVEAMKK